MINIPYYAYISVATVVRAQRLGIKARYIPSVCHLDRGYPYYDDMVSRNIYNTIKLSNVGRLMDKVRGPSIAVARVSRKGIKINLYRFVEGFKQGDFVGVRELRKRGLYGAIYTEEGFRTVDGMARHNANFYRDTGKNNPQMGFLSNEPYASLTLPINRKELDQYLTAFDLKDKAPENVRMEDALA